MNATKAIMTDGKYGVTVGDVGDDKGGVVVAVGTDEVDDGLVVREAEGDFGLAVERGADERVSVGSVANVTEIVCFP